MATKTEPIKAVRDFLDRHVTTRRTLIIVTTVAAPATLGLLALGDQFALPRAAIATGAIIITLVALLLGAVLVATESSSGELAGTLLSTNEELLRARERIRRDGLRRDADRAQHDAEASQLNAIGVLRDRFFFLINLALEASYRGDSISIPNTTSLLLDEIGALAPFLLRLTAIERWSFAIYLLDDEKQLLTCGGDVRNASKDAGAGHRSWSVGRGMVGVTAFTGRTLVVSDTASSDLEGIIRDPDEARAADDRIVYRSVAAVPIYKPDAPDPETETEQEASRPAIHGVVIATSDVAERFKSEADDELAPLQALADAVAMVLIAAEFSSGRPKSVGPLDHGADSSETLTKVGTG
jgi:hypothetical protein